MTRKESVVIEYNRNGSIYICSNNIDQESVVLEYNRNGSIYICSNNIDQESIFVCNNILTQTSYICEFI